MIKKITLLMLFVFAFSWQGVGQLIPDDTCSSSFIDISATGTDLGLGDDGEANIVSPFSFTLDGISSSDLRVGNNGGVLFNATAGNIFGSSTPTAQGFYPFADDLADGQGGVFWEVQGASPNRKLIIQWNDLVHYVYGGNTSSGVTLEMILEETTNDVYFIYNDLDFADATFDNGVSAGVRIVGANGVYEYSTDTSIAGISCVYWTAPTTIPNCDATLTSATTDAPIDTITWSAATGFPSGYKLTVGTASGGSDVLSVADVGDVTTYTFSPELAQGTMHYVTITSYNANGDATGCTEQTFTTLTRPVNDDCSGATAYTDSYTMFAQGACSGSNSLDLSFATDDTSNDNPSCDSSGNYGVWYTWTADATGLKFTSGTQSPGLAVYDAGTCGSLNSVGCLNNTSGEITGLTVGNDYVLFIWDDSANVVEFCIEKISTYNPIATYTTAADCANSQFTVDVEVTDMGGAASVTIADDQGSTVQQLTAVGTKTFGPYTSGTTVAFTVTNDADSTFTSGDTIVFNCPPANDDCSGAFPLTVNTDLNCTSITSGSLVGATASAEDAAACSGTENDDVWFSFVATATSHQIKLLNKVGSPIDLYHSVWEGTCGSLALLSGSCSDGDTSNPNGMTIGNTYFVRVNSYSSSAGANTTFDICVGTTPPPPVNDDCSGAITIIESTDSNCNNVVSGTTISATHSGDYSCSSTYEEVWYKFTAATTANYVISRAITNGSTTNTYLSLWTGGCGSLTKVNSDCSLAMVDEWLTAGTEYYISVASSSPEVNFDLCVHPRSIYCVPGSSSTVLSASTYIDTFTTTNGATNISNVTTGFTSGYYADYFDSMSVSGSPNSTFNFNVEIIGGTVGCAVWIDWNNDLDFDPATETVFNTTEYTNGPFTGAITIPSGTVNGDYRMRIMIDYNDSNPDDNACLHGYRAEVEDYKIVVDNSLAVSNAVISGFAYYPNPVNDQLSLRADNAIDQVEMMSVLGQTVLAVKPNVTETTLDISTLKTGTYFVRVQVGDAIQIVKVIKQ